VKGIGLIFRCGMRKLGVSGGEGSMQKSKAGREGVVGLHGDESGEERIGVNCRREVGVLRI